MRLQYFSSPSFFNFRLKAYSFFGLFLPPLSPDLPCHVFFSFAALVRQICDLSMSIFTTAAHKLNCGRSSRFWFPLCCYSIVYTALTARCQAATDVGLKSGEKNMLRRKANVFTATAAVESDVLSLSSENR